MVAILHGFWWDHSQSIGLAPTLTLPVEQGYLLLSALTFLVTVAEVHCWGIVAFVLHHLRAKHSAGALDLQHRVTLRNSAGAARTLWETIRIHLAWAPKQPKDLIWRTLSIAVPALVVTVGFTIAALFTSRVAANKAHGAAIARAAPLNCGYRNWTAVSGSNFDNSILGASLPRDAAARARRYADSFYANDSISSVASTFVQLSLPYDTNPSAPCPIPATHRCRPGPYQAFSVTSALLDSHEMLGVNAPFSDRVAVQLRNTCSPIWVEDLIQMTIDESGGVTHANYLLGSVTEGQGSITYRYRLAMGNNTGLGYTIRSYNSEAERPPNLTSWDPIADFVRNDATVIVVLLAQNDIRYPTPVYDPWFSANGTFNQTLKDTGDTAWLPDYVVSPLICAEQFRFCSPSNRVCSSYGSWWQHSNRLGLFPKTMGFNTAQMATVSRILKALEFARTGILLHFLGVEVALRASRLAILNLSAGLPDNQWHIEVEGWFQTQLAMLQAAVVEFSVKEGNSMFEKLQLANNISIAYIPEGMDDQCGAQLVRTVGEVQNFSVVGVLLVVCLSVALIAANLSLEWIVDYLGALRERRPVPRAAWARQADSELHLLRLALTGAGGGEGGGGVQDWVRGWWGVPVPREDDARRIETSMRDDLDRLASYVVEPLQPSEGETLQHEYVQGGNQWPYMVSELPARETTST